MNSLFFQHESSAMSSLSIQENSTCLIHWWWCRKYILMRYSHFFLGIRVSTSSSVSCSNVQLYQQQSSFAERVPGWQHFTSFDWYIKPKLMLPWSQWTHKMKLLKTISISTCYIYCSWQWLGLSKWSKNSMFQESCLSGLSSNLNLLLSPEKVAWPQLLTAWFNVFRCLYFFPAFCKKSLSSHIAGADDEHPRSRECSG